LPAPDIRVSWAVGKRQAITRAKSFTRRRMRGVSQGASSWETHLNHRSCVHSSGVAGNAGPEGPYPFRTGSRGAAPPHVRPATSQGDPLRDKEAPREPLERPAALAVPAGVPRSRPNPRIEKPVEATNLLAMVAGLALPQLP
jgi:hypothetical protein